MCLLRTLPREDTRARVLGDSLRILRFCAGSQGLSHAGARGALAPALQRAAAGGRALEWAGIH
eukprot:6177070-Alexandrium_andersonii.AAC.1